MMSKRRTTQSKEPAVLTAQLTAARMLIPGMLVSLLAFLTMVNWIAAPTEAVQASSSQGTGQEITAPSPELMPSQPEKNAPTEGAPAGECSIGSRYPDSIRQWCGLIESAASRYGLQPDLLAAVMLQESGGNPNAYSSSGAVGLLQVMPRDGIAAGFQCENGPCFANRPTMEQLFDPAFNVDYGARMLSGLIARSGSLRDGLLAYGPMDVGYHYADLVLTIMQNYR